MAKTTQIQIRCDEFQKQQLREMADREGTTISQLLLTRVLGASGAPLSDAMEKEREAIENNPSNLNATLDEKGSILKKEPDKPSQEVLRARAMELVRKKGLSYKAARAQVEREG